MFDGFQKKAGLQIANAYRNTVQAATDLAEGRIQLMMSAYAILRPHVESGKLKSARGDSVAARVDSEGCADHGGGRFPRHYIDGLVGIFGLRDMPAAVRERIAADVIAGSEGPRDCRKS